MPQRATEPASGSTTPEFQQTTTTPKRRKACHCAGDRNKAKRSAHTVEGVRPLNACKQTRFTDIDGIVNSLPGYFLLQLLQNIQREKRATRKNCRALRCVIFMENEAQDQDGMDELKKMTAHAKLLRRLVNKYKVALSAAEVTT
eukprot:1040469-Rhodomonas_salina.1